MFFWICNIFIIVFWKHVKISFSIDHYLYLLLFDADGPTLLCFKEEIKEWVTPGISIQSRFYTFAKQYANYFIVIIFNSIVKLKQTYWLL